MDREALIQRIEEVKFLNFRSAASLGRGFMSRAVPALRRTSRRAKLFAGGARQHMRAGSARKFKRKGGGIAYDALNPGRAGQGGFGKAFINQRIAAGDKGRARMVKHGIALAPAIGTGIIAASAITKGVSNYVKWKRKQKEKTKYRNLAIYPEHGYAAVGIQPYNQPYYNEPVRSGPPAHQRASIGGMYERDELIDNIVEAIRGA